MNTRPPTTGDSNSFSRHRKSGVAQVMGLAAGHLRAKDIVHVNTGAWKLAFAQRIFNGPPLVVISIALVLYVAMAVIFGGIFYSFGVDCYKLDYPEDFDFASMLWMSVHAFSTIGFGNLAPRQTCAGAQVVLLIESFVSLLVGSAIGGYVVKQFLRPLAAVRFSSVILLNRGRRRIADDDEENAAGPEYSTTQAQAEYRFLTFRMVRQGLIQLRDVRVKAQVQWWSAGTTAFGDRDHHKGRVANLKLEQDYFTTLEQLQVWHRVDESSPLWRMRDSLDRVVDGIEVSVSSFDTASLQQVVRS